MRITTLTLLLILTILTTDGLCQKVSTRYFDDPIMTDSLSTLFIPTKYNDEFLASNKMAIWNEYHANILVYNFKTDTYKKLFEKDTFIERIRDEKRYGGTMTNLTTKWIFLLIKTKDTNSSGRIDEKDPSVLFAVSNDGNSLKQITDETENVVWFNNYNSQGFFLIKIQRDSDNDKSFKNEDEEFYYRKVNLSDLSLGKEIVIK